MEALEAVSPSTLAALCSTFDQNGKSIAAMAKLKDAPYMAYELVEQHDVAKEPSALMRAAGAAVAHAAFKAPPAYIDLLGPFAGPGGGGSRAVGCVRAQFACAAAHSMKQVRLSSIETSANALTTGMLMSKTTTPTLTLQVVTPAGLARKLLTLQALRGAVVAGPADALRPPIDCLTELAVEVEFPLAPYLMAAEEACGLADRLALGPAVYTRPVGFGNDKLNDDAGCSMVTPLVATLLLQTGCVTDPVAVGPWACTANAYRAYIAMSTRFQASTPLQADGV